MIRGLKLRGFTVTVQGLKKGAFRYGGFTDSEFDMVSMLLTDITSEKEISSMKRWYVIS